eukprot:92485_1
MPRQGPAYTVGDTDGLVLGDTDGSLLGDAAGLLLGDRDGLKDGDKDGLLLGLLVSAEGAEVTEVGLLVGRMRIHTLKWIRRHRQLCLQNVHCLPHHTIDL